MNQKIAEAKRLLSVADHMAYISYPVMQESRLLIKMLEHIEKSLGQLIGAILDNEYLLKRAQQYSDPKDNFRTFVESSPRYGLKKGHLEAISQIKGLMEMHSQSPMEFVKNEKFIIMSDGSRMGELTLEKVKAYISLMKEMLKSAESAFEADSRAG